MNINREEVITTLLDTNALTNLMLFIELCQVGQKSPRSFGSGDDLRRFVAEYSNRRNIPQEIFVIEGKGGIIQGFHVFVHIIQSSKEVFISRVCENEALHLLLERRADQVLTRAGVPFRLRRKRFVRTQVNLGYEEVLGNWNSFMDCLEKNGVELKYAEDDYRDNFWKDALSVQQILMKYILMESADLLIYATGILANVDEIYTYDDEFKKIINLIRHPPNDDWRQIRTGIELGLAEALVSRKEEYNTRGTLGLPEGVP